MEIQTAKKLMAMVFAAMLLMLMSAGTVSATVTVEKLTQLTTDPAHDHNPQWSPNGNEIVFQRMSNPQKMIKLKLDDLSETLLTTHQYPGIFCKHSYSQDGTKIVYVKDYGTGWVDVYVMNSDGSSNYCITCSDSGENDGPTWYSKSNKIIYENSPNCCNWYPWDVISINPDGSGKTILASGLINSYHAMSPDESKILYSAETSKDSHIYMMKVKDLNTGTVTNLDLGVFSCHLFSSQTQSWQSQIFSPDGSKVVYYSDENGNWDIYTINADGTGKTQLTTDTSNDFSAYFSPDGSKILFVSDRTGNNDIWVMDADGNNKVQLTTSTLDDIQPSWSPDGSKILFKSDRSGNYNIWVMELAETSIPATIDIDPDTLNLKSRGKWITCYIELPEDYDVADIDVSTILLDTISAEAHPTEIGDYDADDIADLLVKFDRSAVQEILEVGEEVEITVTGELTDGTPFEGSDTIRVIE